MESDAASQGGQSNVRCRKRVVIMWEYKDEKWEYKVEKLPLGIMPKSIWQAQRRMELIGALERYSNAGKPAPAEWFKELRELTE